MTCFHFQLETMHNIYDPDARMDYLDAMYDLHQDEIDALDTINLEEEIEEKSN